MRRACIGLLVPLLVLLLGPALARAAGPPPVRIGATHVVAGTGALDAIACADARDCEAVGASETGAAVTVAIVDGTPRAPLSVAGLAPTDELALDAVACPRSGLCEAVGRLVAGDGSAHAVVVSIVDGRPGAPQVLAGPGPAGSELDAISCPTRTECLAVGDGASTTIRDGVAGRLREESSAGLAALTGIICPTATGCLALGADRLGIGVLVPVGASGLGRPRAVPGTGALRTGACASAGDCELTGTDVTGGSELLARSGRRVGAPRPAAGVDLTGLACPAVGLCLATGSAVPGGGRLVTVRDGRPGPALAGSFGAASAIACPSTGLCLVAGTDGAAAGSLTRIAVTAPGRSRVLGRVLGRRDQAVRGRPVGELVA